METNRTIDTSQFQQNRRSISVLTALAALALVVSSLLAVPGVYTYNSYVGDGGDDQLRTDGVALSSAGAGLATAGGAAVAAGKYAGVTSLAYAGGIAATGGLGLAAIGAGMVA